MNTPIAEIEAIGKRVTEIQAKRERRAKEFAPEVLADMAKLGAFEEESAEIAELGRRFVELVETLLEPRKG